MEGAISSFQQHLTYLLQSNKALRGLCSEVKNGLITLDKSGSNLSYEQRELLRKLIERLKETE